MAIRFQCSSCSQPIEVDDEWACQPVGCPYCRRTITAPAQSTLTAVHQIPLASPLGGSPTAAAAFARGPAGHGVAVAAFVLAMVVMIAVGMATMIEVRNALEARQMKEEIHKLQAQDKSLQQAMFEYLNARGGQPPGWVLAVSLLYFTAAASCVASIVCGILGLRYAGRRPLAATALVISGTALIYFCVGFAFSLALIGSW